MSNVTAGSSLTTLLEKTKHYDKDERWMATSDLCTFMQRSPGLDSQTEARICAAILNLLNDDSADVQAIAVRTLTTLYSICTPQLRAIASTLLGRLLSEDSENSTSGNKSSGLRDVYANGLKKLFAVLSTLDSTLQVQVVSACIDPLLRGVMIKANDKDIALFSLEVLGELMLHFGHCEIIVAQGERIVGILLGVLKGGQTDLIKRAIPCLGRTTAHLSTALVERTVDTLIDDIKYGKNLTPIYVQTLSSLTQHCGRNIRGKGSVILNILMQFIEPLDEDDIEEDEDEEEVRARTKLRESTFTAISSLITSTPAVVLSSDMTNLNNISSSLNYFLKYDPNYFDDDDDDDESMQASVDEYSDEEENEYEAYGGEEEDDESWKIRRASLRCVDSLIKLCKRNATDENEFRKILESHMWITNSEMQCLADCLIVRLKSERENHVLIDVLSTFQLLIESTSDKNILIGPKKSQILLHCVSLLKTKDVDVKVPVLKILGSVNEISCGDKEESTKVRENVILLLCEDSKNLKFAALSYLMSLKPQAPTDEELDKIVQLTQTKGEWYKIHALALDVLAKSASACTEMSRSAAEKIYAAIEVTFLQPDLDASIKISTLLCCSSLLSSILAKDLSQDEIRHCIDFLCAKCEEVSVRSTALKALSSVCSSEIIDFSQYFVSTISFLAVLLSREQKLSMEYIRTFKQGVLDVILALLPRGICFIEAKSIDTSSVEKTLSELLMQIGELVTPIDLHISCMALRVTISALALNPVIAKLVASSILEPCLALACSPLLSSSGDPCLDAIADILQVLVKSNALDFKKLYVDLHSRAAGSMSDDASTAKRSLHNLAVCLASIAFATTSDASESVQLELVQVSSQPENDLQLILALTTLAELGQRMDLSRLNHNTKFYDTLLKYLEEGASEDIKACAAYALGHVCIGSMASFLPLLLNAFEGTDSTRKTQYLLLSSLKEIIIYHHKHKRDDAIIDNISTIEPHLVRHFGQKEEGVRTMVAECMGALAALYPSGILPSLENIAKSSNGKDTKASWTVMNSVRCAIVNGIDGAALRSFMPTVVSFLDEDDLEARTACLLTINSVIHYQPEIFSADTQTLSEIILPRVYKLAQIKQKRQVDLGPFKEIVDDALPMRRASMSIFATCLKNCPRCLDIPGFMPILAASLSDVQDAQLQAHQIIITMCAQDAEALLPAVNSFAQPLEKTCTKTIKGQKTASEIERINEWIKSALRTSILLSRLEGIDQQQKFCEFINRITSNAALTEMLSQLNEELRE